MVADSLTKSLRERFAPNRCVLRYWQSSSVFRHRRAIAEHPLVQAYAGRVNHVRHSCPVIFGVPRDSRELPWLLQPPVLRLPRAGGCYALKELGNYIRVNEGFSQIPGCTNLLYSVALGELRQLAMARSRTCAQIRATLAEEFFWLERGDYLYGNDA